MCFVSWLVWSMIKDPFMADLLFALGFWFIIPLVVWAIVVFLQSSWKKGILWKIYQIWGCAIIILIGANAFPLHRALQGQSRASLADRECNKLDSECYVIRP